MLVLQLCVLELGANMDVDVAMAKYGALATEQTAKVMAKIPPNWMMVSQIQTLPSSGLSE